MQQRKRNRLLALVLIPVLIFGLLPVSAAASAPDTMWTDYASDSFAGGSGTKDDLCQIATAEQPAKPAVDINANAPYINYSGAAIKAEKNSAARILAVNDLDLSNAVSDKGELATEGYHWDADSKTLSLGDGIQFGSVSLPENDAVTVITNGENHFNSICVKGSGSYGQSYKMDITIAGSGKLTVEEGIYSGMDGDALTVDFGAELVANGGINIGSSGGVNSTITVKGRLSAKSTQESAIYAGKVVVTNTGELYVSGAYGVTLNGMRTDSGIHYNDVLTIDDGGAFHSDCTIYAVCIFTNYIDSELSEEDTGKIIVLPNLYLPLGYELRAVKGSQDEWGTQYGITIAEETSETEFKDGELNGAAGSISLISHDHILTHIAAVPKTCTDDGHTQYWTCKTCGRIYSNEDGTTQIQLTETVIPASHEPVYHAVKQASCTENGNIEYQTCNACGKYFSDENCTNEITAEDTIINALGHDFSGAYDAYDESGHWHICHRDNCNVTETPIVHSFTSYTYNGDATYFADGTETAVCDVDGCAQTHTRTKSGTRLIDLTAPTGEIKVKENSFKSFINTITFGIFCKDRYDVTVSGQDDETGISSIEYHISQTPVSEEDIVNITEWEEYSAFSIADDGKYIIYAKITNNVGNVVYISSDGMVIDKTVPVISGLTDGKTYCSELTFTVADENLDYVTVNGVKTTDYTLKADGSTYEVKAVDRAGNESIAYTVTVNNGHTFTSYVSDGNATCTSDGTETAKCDFCDAADTRTQAGSKHAHTMTLHEAVQATCIAQGNVEYFSCSECHMNYDSVDGGNVLDNVITDIDPNNHSLVYHAVKQASCTENGNIEYQTCNACGKYFSDEACTNEITAEDTVIKAEGHKTVIRNKKDATCTSEGYTGDYVCTVCGEVIQKGTVIEKLDHNYKDGECTNCGLLDSDFKPDKEPVNPKTGDNSNFIMWIVLLLAITEIVLLRVFICNKKRKK